MFQYAFAKLKAPLEKLNDWNQREVNLSRAYLRKNGQTVIEGRISCDPGLAPAQLKSFYEKVEQERQDFLKFVLPSTPRDTRNDTSPQGVLARGSSIHDAAR